MSPAQRKGSGRSTPRKAPASKAPAPPRFSTAHRVALIVLALAVVLTTAGFAIFRGLGNPSIPSDAIAVVDDAPNGTVTKAEYGRALFQAVPRIGLSKLPPRSSPQFTTVKQSAISDLLLQRWIEGEAQERGIDVSGSVVQDKLKSIISSQFSNSQKQFDAFLVRAHFTPADALERVRLQLLSTHVQNEVLPKNPPKVSDDAITNYYNANITQFQQPATRDVRLVLNKSKAQVEKAKAALDADDSTANWKKVAQQYSTDPTTKSVGGLRAAVAQGQSEPALDKALFAAPAHQIIGPIKGQAGYYVIEVEAINPAATTPLAKVRTTIQQQLATSLQGAIATQSQTNFTNKWTSRTFCAPGYLMFRCSNYEPPPTCTEAAAAKTGCPAFVDSIKPVEPGHAAVFFTIPQQLPQGPIQPPSKGGAALPGGTPIPLGPGGAPAAPGSTAPVTPGGWTREREARSGSSRSGRARP